jgi:hypothetical protein
MHNIRGNRYKSLSVIPAISRQLHARRGFPPEFLDPAATRRKMWRLASVLARDAVWCFSNNAMTIRKENDDAGPMRML